MIQDEDERRAIYSRGEIEQDSGDREGKAVQNDEAGSIASHARRVGRHIDRLIAAAILQVPVESQTAKPRVTKLAVLESGVLDDRDKTRPQKTKTVAEGDRGREGR
jgi:hypothetical protein